MQRIAFLLILFALAATELPAAEVSYVPSALVPPSPLREMRAAWIATVANIDWPSKPGLTVAQQKAELISLLTQAQLLHFNAVFFQVRSVADAMYASPFEPWSEYLTGVQGKMPQPFYDPLAFAVEEAHKRGLELHAWFNPFRAAHPQSKSAPALNHVTRTQPEIIRHYGSQTWMDPGDPESRSRAERVVLDVVKRYDVDGVVFDDYFYPYPEGGRDFPDTASWEKYGKSSGLSRDNWRRANVNQLIQKLSGSIKAAKPWVQFGISPFGIWRPGVPPGINRKALDAYGQLYADARAWLANGWVDYLAPQLYWPTAQRDLSFPVLLKWWCEQNTQGRHIWAAVNDAGVGGKFTAAEIGRQIQLTRLQAGSSGEVHYHLRSITENPALRAVVSNEYNTPALVPTTPWMDSTRPEKPQLSVFGGENSAKVSWNNAGPKPARWWVMQTLQAGKWTTQILPAVQTTYYFEKPAFDAISIRAVDRLGNLSAPEVLAVEKH
jgi:uncharacterized lipoprotein YddW (UPF0748 family)